MPGSVVSLPGRFQNPFVRLRLRQHLFQSLVSDLERSEPFRFIGFHSAKLAGENPPSLDQLLEVYRLAWQDRSGAEVRFGKTESVESLD